MKDSSSATERVGRYQLLEPIGGGPNGIVARAKVFGVAGFERQFAVKRFHAELTVGAAAQALSAAARSYGSLEHPRIARMSEFGVAQGQTFTAVEYVPGLDVFRLLQEAKLASVAIAAGGALALVSQAARAVGYAHGRGLSHLGLSPTNVIVTADGDVKVTDFGILAATMPGNPIETPRLASRVPYLSPEQVAGEATSAATDVFVLGVIAYELVTGQRAYRGDNPVSVSHAILAGPPPEPPLPRPIVRVLQRCLARSPFERFPDARALADALDAALRVAPVPGTRKDVGAQVKTTLERYAQLNEGNVSGMVALNLTSSPPPSSTRNDATQPMIPTRPEARTEPSGTPTFSQTLGMPRDQLRPPATVPGVPPPPSPVPPGVNPPPVPTIPAGPTTIPGLTPPAAKKPPIPSIKPPPSPATKPPATLPSMPKAGSVTQSWDALSDVPVDLPTKPSITPPTTPPTAPPTTPLSKPPTSLTQGWDAIQDTDLAPPTLPTVGRSLTQGWDAAPDTEQSPPSPSAFTDAAVTRPAAPAIDSLAAMSNEPVFELTADDEESSTPAPRPHRPTPGQNFESATGEMSQQQIADLNRRAVLTTSNQMPVAKVADDIEAAIAAAEPEIDLEPSAPASSTLTSLSPPPPAPPPRSSNPELPLPAPAASSVDAPVITSSPPEESAESITAPADPVQPPRPPQATRLPLLAGIVLGVGVLGAGGYVLYSKVLSKSDAPTVAAGSGSGSGAGSQVAVTPPPSIDAAVAARAVDASVTVATATTDAAVIEIDAATEVAVADAAIAPPIDAATQVAATGSGDPGSQSNDGKPPAVKPSGTSDQLQVTSTPDGAKVFLDGSELGKTPLNVPGSADRHTLTVLLPGHDLYLAEVEGHGKYDVALAPVKPTKAGPGIKVETCKVKDRYYIYVDGVPSGQTCPTAKRIVTTLGKHTVEIYDIVTETRKKYDVDLKDDRLSFRIKIED